MEDNRTTVVFNLDRNLSKSGQRSQNILLQASLKNKSLSVRIEGSENASIRNKSLSVSENISSEIDGNRNFGIRQSRSFSEKGAAQPSTDEHIQCNFKTDLMQTSSDDSCGSSSYSVFSNSCDSSDSNSCSDELEKCKVVKINLQQDYLEVLKNLRETDLSEKNAEGAETEIVFHKVPAEAVERMRRLTNELNQRR